MHVLGFFCLIMPKGKGTWIFQQLLNASRFEYKGSFIFSSVEDVDCKISVEAQLLSLGNLRKGDFMTAELGIEMRRD